jgi:hypothetical protein
MPVQNPKVDPRTSFVSVADANKLLCIRSLRGGFGDLMQIVGDNPPTNPAFHPGSPMVQAAIQLVLAL